MVKPKKETTAPEVLEAIDDVVGFIRVHMSKCAEDSKEFKAYSICDYYIQGLLQDFAVKGTYKNND